jgi:hypothetical protein
VLVDISVLDSLSLSVSSTYALVLIELRVRSLLEHVAHVLLKMWIVLINFLTFIHLVTHLALLLGNTLSIRTFASSAVSIVDLFRIIDLRLLINRLCHFLLLSNVSSLRLLVGNYLVFILI